MCTCSFDYETPEFTSTTTPRSRVEHECYECGRVIPRGFRYERQAQKVDGSFSVMITCVDCCAWRDALFEAQEFSCGCNGYYFGQLWREIAEFCEEHLGYEPDGDYDAATDPDFMLGRREHPNQPLPYVNPRSLVEGIRYRST